MLPPLDDNEDCPTRLWAEIHKLRNEAKGPDGFATWYDAAVDERVRRVKAEKHAQELTGHLVILMSESWTYVHGYCTIQTVKQHWQDVRDYLSSYRDTTNYLKEKDQ